MIYEGVNKYLSTYPSNETILIAREFIPELKGNVNL